MKIVSLALNAGLMLIGGVLGVQFVLQPQADQRGWRYMPDMDHSYAYASQSDNPFLPLGQTAMQPAPDTIARGAMPLRYDSSVKDYVRAGNELSSPFDPDHPADPDRAAGVYSNFCQVCHGADGAGNGTVPQHGFPAPPSLLFGKAVNMNDGHIFHIITHGWRNMPSYSAQLDVEERWLAIAHLRRLQENAR